MSRILVCKVGGLGDTLSMLPALAALRRARPDAVLTLLSGPAGAEVVPDALGVRVVTVARDRLSGGAGLRLLPELMRRVGPQEVALLSHDECSCVHLLARMVARRRIGFAAGVARGERLLNDRLPFDDTRSPYLLSLDLIVHVCGADTILERVAPYTAAPPSSGPWMAGPDAYGILHPGAAGQLQRWGVGRFGRVARRLAEATGYPWLLVDANHGLSVRQLGGLIAGARGFVGNHSGPLHLAAALGVPWVAVAGPSARAWDPPWPDVPGRVLRASLPCVACGRIGAPARDCASGTPGACLDAITPDAVVDAVVAVLGQAP